MARRGRDTKQADGGALLLRPEEGTGTKLCHHDGTERAGTRGTTEKLQHQRGGVAGEERGQGPIHQVPEGRPRNTESRPATSISSQRGY